MKKLLAALLVATSSISASASVLTYTLQNVAFADGATASGSFGWDTATSQFTTMDVSTTAGVISAYHYGDVATSNLYTPNFFAPNSIIFIDGSYNQYLNLAFDSSINTTGVHNLILTGQTSGSWECDDCNINRNVVSGFVTSDAAAVPEPAMLGLFGMGAMGLGLARRRKAA